MRAGRHLQITETIGERFVSRLRELCLGLQLFPFCNPTRERLALLLNVEGQVVGSLLKQRSSRVCGLHLLARKLSTRLRLLLVLGDIGLGIDELLLDLAL